MDTNRSGEALSPHGWAADVVFIALELVAAICRLVCCAS